MSSESFHVTSGAAFGFDVSTVATGGSVAPDFATTPVTLVLDGPTARHVFKWRPAGVSDDGFTLDAGVLSFTGIDSTFTATYLAEEGSFPLYVCEGEVVDVQQAVGKLFLKMHVPPRGPLPVVDS